MINKTGFFTVVLISFFSYIVLNALQASESIHNADTYELTVLYFIIVLVMIQFKKLLFK